MQLNNQIIFINLKLGGDLPKVISIHFPIWLAHALAESHFFIRHQFGCRYEHLFTSELLADYAIFTIDYERSLEPLTRLELVAFDKLFLKNFLLVKHELPNNDCPK